MRKAITLCVSFILVCIGIAACTSVQEQNEVRIVSERIITQIDFSSWMPESFKISPDNTRVAYTAQDGNKEFVVVDGKEEKQYDGIITFVGGRIVFDSPDTLHYLAVKGNRIYLIEERIK